MSPSEKCIVDALGEAFAAYVALFQERSQGGHPDDVSDFRYYHIHRLQYLVAARVAYRELYVEEQK